MSRRASTILFAGPDGCRLGGGTSVCTADLPPHECAQRVAAALKADGGLSTTVILAIDSAWCLATPISLDGLPRKDRPLAMSYRLEEQLPVAAEDVAADFIEGPREALAVAAVVAFIAPVLVELETMGIEVAAVCPTALLVAYGIARSRKDATAVIVQHERGIDVIALREGNATQWHAIISGLLEDARLHLLAMQPAGARVETCGCDAEARAAIARWPNVLAVNAAADGVEAAANAYVASGTPLPVDLRRGGLEPADPLRTLRRPIRHAALASLVLLVTLLVATGWQCYKAKERIKLAEAAKEALYREVYPKGSLPPSITSRLASEARRLTAATATGSAPASDHAVRLLAETLSRLPAEAPFRLNAITINDAVEVLDGEAASREVVDELVTALKAPRTAEAGGSSSGQALDVGAPRVEVRPDRSVAFTLEVRAATPARTGASRRRG